MPKRRAAGAAAPTEEEAAGPRRGRRARAGADAAEPPAAPAEEAAATPRRSLRTRAGAVGAAERPAARAPGQLRVGTSGYSYAGWHAAGGLHEGLPAAAEFPRYASGFNSVEINSLFYSGAAGRTPEVFDRWRAAAEAADAAAPGRAPFKFAIKAPMYYTHKKRLAADAYFRDSWAALWARAARLGPRLGPVLFQLPANFATTTARGESNLARLRALGDVLPRGGRFAFEFRHASWHCEEVYSVLAQHNWCLAACDVAPEPGEAAGKSWAGTLRRGANPPVEDYPLRACSWGAYVRFHGAGGKYKGRYGAAGDRGVGGRAGPLGRGRARGLGGLQQRRRRRGGRGRARARGRAAPARAARVTLRVAHKIRVGIRETGGSKSGEAPSQRAPPIHAGKRPRASASSGRSNATGS